MMIKTAERIWGAALSMSSDALIDKFLDWVEGLSGLIVPAQKGALAYEEAQSEWCLDAFSAKGRDRRVLAYCLHKSFSQNRSSFF